MSQDVEGEERKVEPSKGQVKKDDGLVRTDPTSVVPDLSCPLHVPVGLCCLSLSQSDPSVRLSGTGSVPVGSSSGSSSGAGCLTESMVSGGISPVGQKVTGVWKDWGTGTDSTGEGSRDSNSTLLMGVTEEVEKGYDPVPSRVTNTGNPFSGVFFDLILFFGCLGSE